jgi:hypothetical protein
MPTNHTSSKSCSLRHAYTPQLSVSLLFSVYLSLVQLPHRPAACPSTAMRSSALRSRLVDLHERRWAAPDTTKSDPGRSGDHRCSAGLHFLPATYCLGA